MIDLYPIGVLLVIAAIIIALGIYAVWKYVKDRKSSLPVTDERTRKVNGQAAYFALFVGLYFTLGLIWVIFLGPKLLGLPEIEAEPALIASLLVSSISFFVFRWYLRRKEDF